MLAATGSPSWGVYAGYELFEHVAVRPGSEEYLDSREVPDPGPRLGRRRGRGPHAGAVPHPAQRDPPRAPGPAAAAQRRDPLQRRREHPGVLQAAVRPDAASDTVLVVVNLDPHAHPGDHGPPGPARAGAATGTTASSVHDEITGADWTWGQHNYVRLDPGARARPRPDREEPLMTAEGVGRPDPNVEPTSTTARSSSLAPARHSPFPDQEGRRPTGSRPRSSTRCWSAPSTTPTATASATSRA